MSCAAGTFAPWHPQKPLDLGPSLQRTLPNRSRWEAPPGPTPDISTPHESILAMCSGRSEAIHRQVMNLCSEVMEDSGYVQRLGTSGLGSVLCFASGFGKGSREMTEDLNTESD